jgi:hypothetical protein
MAAFLVVLSAATAEVLVWLDEVEVIMARVLEAEVEVEMDEEEAMAVAFLLPH